MGISKSSQWLGRKDLCTKVLQCDKQSPQNDKLTGSKKNCSENMRLYHYTSAVLADGILLSSLSIGHMNFMGTIIRPVVWLTSDPKAEGHGLTNGTEKLNESNAAYTEKASGARAKNRSTHNKRKVRLTFDIPSEEMMQLQRFVEYCERTPNGKQFAKRTGLSCYFELNKLTSERLKLLMKSRPTKEKTWWISFLPVSARFITAVEIRDANGVYQPYDFDKLARPALEKLGYFFPSAEALGELQTIVKPLHPLGYTKAHAFCPAPNATPILAIRDGGTQLSYEIEAGKSLTDTAAYEPQLSAWINTYREELMAAWAKAKESYFSYYPEHRI